MLIRRCLWHRELHGYSIVYGVASWRGWRPRFTDGLCSSCARRVRAEWDRSRATRRPRFGLTLDPVIIGACAVALLILFGARALEDHDTRWRSAADLDSLPSASLHHSRHAARPHRLPPEVSAARDPAETEGEGARLAAPPGPRRVSNRLVRVGSRDGAIRLPRLVPPARSEDRGTALDIGLARISSAAEIAESLSLVQAP